MNDFTPIPIPWKQRWRSFRTQWFPIFIFAVSGVLIFVLWESEVTPATLSGEAVGLSASVTAPRSGVLQSLMVMPFHVVEQGQTIGWIQTLPPDRAEAALEELRTEIALIRSGGGDPVLDQQRNFLSWQSLRRDLLLARADVATLTVRAAEAERDLQRKRLLYNQRGISSAELDRAESEFAILSAEKESKLALLEALEVAFNAPESQSFETGEGLQSAMDKTLDLMDRRLQKLELELQPVALIAPIGGRVSAVLAFPGQFIAEGTVVTHVHAQQADYIVGYLRAPAAVIPQPGSRVRVVTQGPARSTAEAQVISVGAQFEPLIPALRHPIAQREERALPIQISIPNQLQLIPGQLLDLVLLEE